MHVPSAMCDHSCKLSSSILRRLELVFTSEAVDGRCANIERLLQAINVHSTATRIICLPCPFQLRNTIRGVLSSHMQSHFHITLDLSHTIGWIDQGVASMRTGRSPMHQMEAKTPAAYLPFFTPQRLFLPKFDLSPFHTRYTLSVKPLTGVQIN